MDIGNIMLLVLWGGLVGLVFSSIGAAGGILASFGLITFIGISDPNTVKPMAQLLALITALVFIPGYFKRSAWVLPLGMVMSAGGVIGAVVGSTFSSLYLSDMSAFKPMFGILAMLVALQIAWKLYKEHQEGKETLQISQDGVSNIDVTLRRMSFEYNGKKYKFNFWLPWFAGFLIAFVASIFGVGGGFLLVPFMASILGMPMFIIPATAALAIFISSSMSIINYLRMGAEIDFSILAIMSVGAIVGALLGPKLNQILKESWLQASLASIVAMISVKYMFSA